MKQASSSNENRDALEVSSGSYVRRHIILGVALFAFLVAVSSCASTSARKKLERVAKDWSETIRASQVIPVYPLTEDLVPGDVFLVQTTIEEQTKIYRKRGFLSLDDHMTRLKGIDYTKMYFSGYWKDEFGNVPHDRLRRESAGPVGDKEDPRAKLTEAMAPRAAFPTYSFEAESSGGLGLAIPIKGIPVGMNFLRADRVKGTITIADARTFAADQTDLYSALVNWIDIKPDVRAMIRNTLKQTGRDYLFLRVVSRVYLTGAVVVSLQRSDSTAAGVSAGNAPNLNLVKADGTVDENIDNALKALNEQSTKITEPFAAGGTIKFASASSSSVTLSESFDRLLVIGYLGFDVPVFKGAVLGAPIPTFQIFDEDSHLAQVQRVDVLSAEIQRFKLEEAALEALVKGQGTSAQAYRVMYEVVNTLNAQEFEGTKARLAAAKESLGTANEKQAVAEAFKRFKADAGGYVSATGVRGPRYDVFSETLATAYDNKKEQIK